MNHYEALGHYNDMNVLSMHALISAYQLEERIWMNELKTVLEKNIEKTCYFFDSIDGVNLTKPQGCYILMPDFQLWCRETGKTLDVLLISGVEVGVL